MGAATHQDYLFGMKVSPLTLRRWHNFCRNRRGYWSLWIFLTIFVFTLFAEFVANDRPFLVYFKGSFYVPIFADYPETTFGGTFKTETEYRDPYVRELIDAHGWMIWPLIPYNAQSVAADLPEPLELHVEHLGERAVGRQCGRDSGRPPCG